MSDLPTNAERDVFHRLYLLARTDPVARIAILNYSSGRPLLDCLIIAAETWAKEIELLQSQEANALIKRPLAPVILVTSEAEKERVQRMLQQ